MSIDRSRPLLCFIHDARTAEPPETLWDVPDSAWEDVDLVQVRGKDLDAGDLETITRGWIERLADLDTLVVVNDRLDVALGCEADGAHLGADDVPLEDAREEAPREGFLIGVSARDRDATLIAQAAGADYVGLGAFFESTTKPDAEVLNPWNTGLMENIPALTIPVLAIGGLTPDRLDDAFRVPAVTGVAVSAAIQGADDPEAAIGAMRAALARCWDARVTAAHT